MQFQKMDELDGWYVYNFCTTYRNGWEDILDLGRVISEFHEVKEIFADDKKYTIDDLKHMTIPEASQICIRGVNKVYDNMPFQYHIQNQTDMFFMLMPKPYTDGLKRSETEFLTDEEKKHTFDRFVDNSQPLPTEVGSLPV